MQKNHIQKSILIITSTLFLAATTWYLTTIFFDIPPTHSTKVITQLPETVPGAIVTLKLLKEEYVIDYHNAFSNLVRQNLEYPTYITLDYTMMHLRHEIDKVKSGTMVHYCIFDNKDNKLIGATAIRDKNDTDPGQFSIWINERYWGGGRALEAAKLITNIYFALKPHEMSFIAHVRLWNKRSYHLLQKAGFKEIGYFYENGKPTRHIMEMRRSNT